MFIMMTLLNNTFMHAKSYTRCSVQKINTGHWRHVGTASRLLFHKYEDISSSIVQYFVAR